jgi:hypothetical protein
MTNKINVVWEFDEDINNTKLCNFIDEDLFRIAINNGVACWGEAEGLDDIGEIENTILTFDSEESASTFVEKATELIEGCHWEHYITLMKLN